MAGTAYYRLASFINEQIDEVQNGLPGPTDHQAYVYVFGVALADNDGALIPAYWSVLA